MKADSNDVPSNLSKVITCDQGSIRAVRYNVDGCYCITCGADKSIKLWNPSTGVLLHKYAGHGLEVLDARASVDNSTIVSCGVDKSVMVWDVVSGQCKMKLRSHYGRVNCLCFNEDSSMVLSGSLDRSIRCWDLRAKRRDPVQILDEALDSISSVSISSYEILSSSLDGNTRVYDIRNGRLTTNCLGAAITCAEFSGDAQCLLTCTSDSTLRLMDKRSGEMLASYKGHTTADYQIACCFTSDEKHVLCGSNDGSVYCWVLVSSQLVNKLEHGERAVVHSLSRHPSQPQLLTAAGSKIYLWTAPITSQDEDG